MQPPAFCQHSCSVSSRFRLFCPPSGQASVGTNKGRSPRTMMSLSVGLQRASTRRSGHSCQNLSLSTEPSGLVTRSRKSCPSRTALPLRPASITTFTPKVCSGGGTPVCTWPATISCDMFSCFGRIPASGVRSCSSVSALCCGGLVLGVLPHLGLALTSKCNLQARGLSQAPKAQT